MNLDQLKIWEQSKIVEGYSPLVYHTPTSLGSNEYLGNITTLKDEFNQFLYITKKLNSEVEPYNQLELFLEMDKEYGFLSNFHHKECIGTFLEYYSVFQSEKFDKVINGYFIPLNLMYVESSCSAPNFSSDFFIYDFQSENDKIDILDYQFYSDNACNFLTIYNMTAFYSEPDRNVSTWQVEITNSTNKIFIFGDSDLQITHDHFIC